MNSTDKSELFIKTGKARSFNDRNLKKYPSPRMCDMCKKIKTCTLIKKPDSWPVIYINRCEECSKNEYYRRRSIA